MGKALDLLIRRMNDDWLIGGSHQQFVETCLTRIEQLSHWKTPPKILLALHNPVEFVAGFIAACATNAHVFLCNPNWASTEWLQVLEMVQPDLIWKEGETEDTLIPKCQDSKRLLAANQELETSLYSTVSFPTPLIMIPTGGSSGKIRFAIHSWETLIASVTGFQQYFELNQVNSFCVLPLYHVSGLMQFLRSFTSGGRLAILSFKEIETAELAIPEPESFFLSLVPTQLQRLLNQPKLVSWLARFQTVLLGGAPAWAELLETARHHRIQLAPTYGMTETASQVATLKPDDFLKGQGGCGQVLPHAQIAICNPTGEFLDRHQTGIVTIWAKSMALGYYPNFTDEASFLTSSILQTEPKRTSRSCKAHPLLFEKSRRNFQADDLGYFDEQGYLHIVGRTSDKIISGGENVFPAEVEAAIRATGLVQDVCIVGESDRHWGQKVTAVYVPTNPAVSPTLLKSALINKLSKFKQPKNWIEVEQLPRNAQGKVNRQQVEKILKLQEQHKFEATH